MDNAPFFDDISEGPAGGQAFWTRAEDGVKIRLGLWAHAPKLKVTGTILLFPGRTEYIEKFGSVAKELTKMGYNVLTVDWRGQGLSDRACSNPMVGHVASFDRFQLDVACMTKAVETLGLAKPLYLLSHSMGGCIALRALHQGLVVKATVFSAPMWGISLSKALRPIAWTTSWLSHTFSKGCGLAPGTNIETYVKTAPFEDNELTTDPDSYALLQRQAKARPELVLGGPSMSWLYTALSETRDLAKMPAPNTPCLTFLGTQERIVDTAPIHALMQRWDNGQLEMLEGAEHEVLIEKPAIRGHVNARLEAFLLNHS